MKIKFTKNNKLIIATSLVVIMIGLLIIGAVFTPLLNISQCDGRQVSAQDNCIIGANIGAALVWGLGVVVASIGGIALIASLAFALVASNAKKARTAPLVAALIVFFSLLTWWYLFMVMPSQEKITEPQTELITTDTAPISP